MDLSGPVTQFATQPMADAHGLARRLWPPEQWTAHAVALLDAMSEDNTPARRFALSAAVLRHLRTDPLLPPALLPPDWPGASLRREYGRFESDLARLLRQPDDS